MVYKTVVIPRDDPSSLVVFIHGLGGTPQRDYWGRVPDFLKYDTKCRDIEIIFWPYGSHKWPKLANWNFLHRLNATVRAENALNAISSLLVSDIQARASQKQYRRVRIFGHSLGGIIALRAARLLEEFGVSINMDRLAVNATPSTVVPAAKIAAFFNFGTNDYVTLLSQPSLIHPVFDNDLMHIRKTRQPTIHTTYFHSHGDEVVAFKRQCEFDQEITIRGAHTWMREIDRPQDLNYTKLLTWMTS